ncbi:MULTISPECIES: DUF1593 domain-containing protein [unclassified Micromonospora]|uniref:DUF1593 domain-containing protein n=1 Tax=unclassified Micromonospora TaxID=2617518 RepID=UPI0036337106
MLVSTDIGGTDPDDFQSMIHLLLYADVLDIEGLVSSPFGSGRKQDIIDMIGLYQRDHARLVSHSNGYPEPDVLRAVTKQGALDSAGPTGVGVATEGSSWIIRCARRPDPRPLHVLVWGGIDDLAQALHDAPDILPNLRVYFVGGPNKTFSVNAYDYLATHHPELWIIEANSTYRGWFVGGDQSGEWGNRSFVATHVAGNGALGSHFSTLLDGVLKMGDSPSVAWLLSGSPYDPAAPGWGGRFVRVWNDRKVVYRRLTTATDAVEAFGTVEFELPTPADHTAGHRTRMVFDDRIPAVAAVSDSVLRFRFSPRDAKVWSYVVRSDHPDLDGLAGEFSAVPPPPERVARPSGEQPNWWTDDQGPTVAEGVHSGAKTVNRWRREILSDFARRVRRCASTPAAPVGPVDPTR